MVFADQGAATQEAVLVGRLVVDAGVPREGANGRTVTVESQGGRASGSLAASNGLRWRHQKERQSSVQSDTSIPTVQKRPRPLRNLPRRDSPRPADGSVRRCHSR